MFNTIDADGDGFIGLEEFRYDCINRYNRFTIYYWIKFHNTQLDIVKYDFNQRTCIKIEDYDCGICNTVKIWSNIMLYLIKIKEFPCGCSNRCTKHFLTINDIKFNAIWLMINSNTIIGSYMTKFNFIWTLLMFNMIG